MDVKNATWKNEIGINFVTLYGSEYIQHLSRYTRCLANCFKGTNNTENQLNISSWLPKMRKNELI